MLYSTVVERRAQATSTKGICVGSEMDRQALDQLANCEVGGKNNALIFAIEEVSVGSGDETKAS